MSPPFGAYLKLLARYVEPQRRRALLLGVLLLAGIGIQVANPLVIRRLIDSAISPGATSSSLAPPAVAFLLFALVSQGLSIGAAALGEDIGWTATNLLRADLARRCLALDTSFHGEHTAGELVERIDGDVNALAGFFSQLAVQLLGSLLLIVGILIAVVRESLTVGATLSVIAGIALAVLLRLRLLGVRRYAAGRKASADFSGYLEEQLTATEDVRASGAVSYVLRRFHEHSRARLAAERAAGLAGGALSAASIGTFTVVYAVTYGISAHLFREGAITLGTVYLIVHYAELLQRPIQQVMLQIDDLQRARAGIHRIRELTEVPITIRDGRGEALPDGALTVAFDRVSFGYDDRDGVLCALSFELAPRKILGVLGRTGSGKTSLARLLMRLYEPASGVIRLGGVDIRELGLSSLRRRVGMVPQEVRIFHGTLRDNLTLFDRSVPDEAVLSALEELGLGGFCASLPRGLDTLLGAGGRVPSAGEAQLLSLARVLLRDPDVVILDEASSRLDPSTEQRIERALDRLFSGRTGIIVAHRLRTVERADEIAFLEDGQLRERGARDALAADRSSRYHALLRTARGEVVS